MYQIPTLTQTSNFGPLAFPRNAFVQVSKFKYSCHSICQSVSMPTHHNDYFLGDSMNQHNGMMFTTQDRDHDTKSTNCAVEFHGAWWYRECHTANLNGAYLAGNHTSFADGVNWYTFRGVHYSLKTAEMKIRPVIN